MNQKADVCRDLTGAGRITGKKEWGLDQLRRRDRVWDQLRRQVSGLQV